ncbi:MAG: fumarate hydratase [Nitrospirota bacterium]
MDEKKFHDAVVDLYREAATSLPADVQSALQDALEKEERDFHARLALSVILENVESARKRRRPLCQDTGIPLFFLKVPAGISHLWLKNLIIRATRTATKKIPLRANAVDVLTDKNSGDNTGIGFPIIYFDEKRGRKIIVDIMLKGSGSENIGQLYKLPSPELNAERDLEGVRRCVLDTIHKAQGRGCPPYIVGVGIGAAKDQVTKLSKEQLMRRLDDTNKLEVLSNLEKKLLDEINLLGIGPMGLGGMTTAMGVKIGVNHRHPASFFVDVTIACWVHRKARMTIDTTDM